MAKDFAEINRLYDEAGVQATEIGQKDALVNKFVKAWENQTARRAAKGGSAMTMALTLAACGGGSDGGGTGTTPNPPAPINPADIPVLGGPGAIFLTTEAGQTVVGTDGNDVIVANTPVSELGIPQTTFTAQTTIDGGAGDADVLNIVTGTPNPFGAPANAFFQVGSSVTGVEIVNIYSGGFIDASWADASNYDGVRQLWQINDAATVTNLADTTTAGFRELTGSNAINVTAANQATSITVALDDVSDNLILGLIGPDVTSATIAASGAGVVADQLGNNANFINVVIDGSDTATTFTLDTDVDVRVANNFEANSPSVTTLDFSGSTGSVEIENLIQVDTVLMGSGDDYVQIGTADLTVSGGAGDDGVVVTRQIASTDSIDGGANGTSWLGGDTLVIAGAAQNFTNAVEAGALSGVTNVEVLGVAGGVIAVDQTLVDQSVFAVVDAGSGGGTLTLTGASSGVKVKAVRDGGNDINITVAGTATTDSVTVELVGRNVGGNQDAGAIVTTSGAETVNIVSLALADEITNDPFTGTNQVSLNSANKVAYVASGAGNLFVTGAAVGTGSSLNASALSGDLTATATPGLLTITGGTGDDEITALTGAKFVLDGGAGDDTLNAAADMTAGTFTGFETLTGVSSYLASQLDGLSIDVTAGTFLQLTAADSIDQTTIDLSGIVFADTVNDGINIDLTQNTALIGDAAPRTVIGSNGFDIITGSIGVDNISGGGGVDIISGGAGADTIDGGAGADVITGGVGADKMTGGAGADRFVFAAGDSTEAARDTISDFTTSADATVADVLDLGAPAIAADILAAAAVDVSAATTLATDVITATIADGIIALGGANAANVDTFAEWMDVAEILINGDADTTAEVVGFEFGGNTYIVKSDATDATVNVIELTGLTGVDALDLTAAANTVVIA